MGRYVPASKDGQMEEEKGQKKKRVRRNSLDKRNVENELVN